MKRQIKKTIAILLIVCFVLSITAAAGSATKGNSNDEKAENSKCYCTNPNCYVVPFKSNEKIYKELSIEWWKWAESIPVSKNPLLDKTGKNADIGQSRSVWFLAGTFFDTTGTNGVFRTVEIPEGKALFFPIINVVATKDNTGLYDTKEQRRAAAKAYIDQVTVHKVELDGKNLDNYRVASKPFEFTNFPKDNILGLSGSKYIPAASDGYWIMLKPLPVGKYTIIIDGKIGSSFETKVTYNINIKPSKH